MVTRRQFLGTIERQALTAEQSEAVITFDNRVQVVAAAGSGKTSIMVARAAYAVLRGIVPPDRILLLAFNKAAAEELRQRVEERLTAAGIDAAGITATTFHAFGGNVIGRATGRKKRPAEWLDSGKDVAMVGRIVDELRDSSFDFRFKWDLYRLLFARMADDPGGGDPDGYDYDTKQTGFQTFQATTVKSQGERLVADFLFLNGVTFEYERPYAHDVADATHSQYRPDFYYPDVDVWHEHWALDGQGKPPESFRGYAESMAWKKSLHHRLGTTLIETTWADILDGRGFHPFANDLKAHGITLDWNPDRPIPGEQPIRHEDLARLMRSFMTHVKSNSLTAHDLESRLKAAKGRVQRYRARVFLDLYRAIAEQWEQRLRTDDSIDFEDMLVQAADLLESGSIDMGYDLVLVDEFQDASHARARLTRALVTKPHRYLLAVGDDWQSINRFAGADLSVMTSFNDWFGEGPTLRLQKTFRSPQSICDTAAGFVSKNPRQLAKQVQSVQPAYGPAACLVRVASRDEVGAALASVLSELAEGVDSGEISAGPSGRVSVDVLGRYNFDRDLMPSRCPRQLDVTFRTVHSSKGLEADYIVLPNVSSGTYGFPSEVVDDPIMALAMAEADDYPHAEERRLFYVALTRARRQVTLIGVEGMESPFVAELLAENRLELSPLSTVDASEPCPTCGKGVLVVRRRRSDGVEFLGCSAFPRCKHTRAIAAW
ncbi:UvrD-helicase domain-containing protein [Nocardioides houyundeii]|uniref:UvrD-helicase domain-containing protein n=1 Tax=Nocardioides houyundeii TaxID=2045452 RepID=UPI001315484F|nr:UvrD-helicase domain-containing protein [Nocardioides houyundeii]